MNGKSASLFFLLFFFYLKKGMLNVLFRMKRMCAYPFSVPSIAIGFCLLCSHLKIQPKRKNFFFICIINWKTQFSVFCHLCLWIFKHINVIYFLKSYDVDSTIFRMSVHLLFSRKSSFNCIFYLLASVICWITVQCRHNQLLPL